MLTRPAVTAVVLALAVSVAGCARTVEPGAPPARSEMPAKPLPSTVAGGSKTITGTVAAGVEQGCLILQGAAATHLLIFDDPAMRSEAKEGVRVTVVGRPEPGMMTTCQQGIPFIVASIRAG